MIYLDTESRRKREYPSSDLKSAGDGKWHCWLHVALASLAYILANIADYLFTVYGIANNASQEANPVVQGYIDIFGVGSGLAICKSLICAIIIFSVIVTRLAYRRKGSEIRVEFVLYAGSIMTLFGGALWLTKLW